MTLLGELSGKPRFGRSLTLPGSVQGGIVRSNCQQMIGGPKIFHDVKPSAVIRRVDQNRFGCRMDDPGTLLGPRFELSACPTGVSDECPDQFRTTSSHDLHLL